MAMLDPAMDQASRTVTATDKEAVAASAIATAIVAVTGATTGAMSVTSAFRKKEGWRKLHRIPPSSKCSNGGRGAGDL